MNNINIKKLIEYPKTGIISKDIFKSKSENISLFCMAAGSELSEHTSTKKAFVYVIEGEGIFNLGNKRIKMNPGILISMKNNEVHSLKAIKNTSFILILT